MEYIKHLIVSLQDCPNPKVHKQDMNPSLAAVLFCVPYRPFQMQAWSCVTSYYSPLRGFTLSYARYGKPRNGYDAMQLRARI